MGNSSILGIVGRLERPGCQAIVAVDAYLEEVRRSAYTRPFAGMRARAFSIGSAVFSRMAQCPIVACAPFVDENGTIVLEWGPVIPPPRRDEEAADLRTTNALLDFLEKAVGRRPTQYIFYIGEDRRWNPVFETWEDPSRTEQLPPVSGVPVHPAEPQLHEQATQMNTGNSIVDRYSLSPTQLGMLFNSVSAPRSGTDIEQIVCTLSENLEVPFFRRAWERVVQHHPLLRTAFRSQEGEDPVQIVFERISVPWYEHDWRSLTRTEQADNFAHFLDEDRYRGFSMNEAPLLRLTLFQSGDAQYQLIWTFHHILIDGRSFSAVLEEVFACYESLREGREWELPQRKPYREYIEWLQLQDVSAAEPYWRRLLEGFATPTPLMVEKASGLKSSSGLHQGDEKVFLSEAVTAALRDFAGANNVTLNTLLQGAWALLLSRYSGEDDVVFGVVRSCRRSAVPGTDEMVGLLVNTLPMRARINLNAPLAGWLGQLRTQWVEMRAYEHTPLARIQKWSSIPAGSPLFNSILMFDHSDLNRELRGHGGNWRNRSFRTYDQTGYPITVTVYDGVELCLQIEFDRALFDPQTITRMLGHFRMLLESMLAGGQQRIADLSMLSEPERRQLLKEWNNTEVTYPEHLLLHELFEVQAEASPDRVAVEFEGEQLTYCELNDRANQLARHLQRLGVGANTLVGVCMERSLELVIALYGVLKAGGAYVPIDPEYPQERIAYMLQDARFSVLLTQSRLLGRLPKHSGTTLSLDEDWQEIGAESTGNLAGVAMPSDLAYMIYTSGSTGKPKGAMNTHRGICNRLLWMQDQYRLLEADRVLQKTPFSFDVSVWEFFWPLSAGARLVVARPGGHRDSAYLVKVITGQKITVLHFVPSMLRVFLEEPGVQECQSLRDVICSGEALPYELQRRFLDLLPAQLHNLYGPTEAAVDVTHWTCRRQEQRQIVPIGRPIANTQIYILDRRLQPVPIGVPGELYIGGVQVGRGYHNRPELTAERFIPDPFREGCDARLYKSGDQCRWLRDGAVEYLGRLDYQVKINGCRIELGEIEATLGRHPAVQQAIVSVQEDASEGKRLIAHIVPDPEYQIASPQDELHPEHLQGWQTVFDEMYLQSTDAPDATFNIAGWKSSYTGAPIPADEMRTWVESTVARILALRPQNVWEIGCGTGLLLHRVAPHCDYYYATDTSASVVEHLQRQVAARGSSSPRIVVRQANAHDFSDLKQNTFDLVVLNSVAQYFPSVSYLVRVLEGAIRALKPGGAIFLGDLRSQPLLEAFHASVQLHQAPPSQSCAELRRKIQTALTQEGELAISPGFFSALQKHLPAISQVEIQMKRGHHRNELTLFRYDAVLRVGAEITSASKYTRLDWKQDQLTLSHLRQYVMKQQDALIVTGIPNIRLESELKALQLLAAGDCPATAGELREVLGTGRRLFHGVGPEDLWALGESLGYHVQVRWSKKGTPDSCDVIFLPETEQSAEGKVSSLLGFGALNGAPAPWRTYGNNPLQSAMTRDLIPELRTQVRANLPDYMMPSAFVIIDKLPLMPNGKLDRHALPLPAFDTLFGFAAADSAPELGTEQKIADIWREVLGVTRIGREDNFFDRGGDSLRLTMVRSRLQKAFNREIALLDLFRFPTIRLMAQHLADQMGRVPGLDKVESEAATRKGAIQRQRQFRQRALENARISSDELTIRS